MSTDTRKVPSIRQMLVRIEPVHIRILRCLGNGERVETRHLSVGGLRGLKVAAGTLRRWGCITGFGLGDGLTDVGRELLASANERPEVSHG